VRDFTTRLHIQNPIQALPPTPRYEFKTGFCFLLLNIDLKGRERVQSSKIDN
jgi:hypothetical protein